MPSTEIVAVVGSVVGGGVLVCVLVYTCAHVVYFRFVMRILRVT